MRRTRTIINTIVVLLAVSPVAYLLLAWNTVPETIRMRFNIDEPVTEEHDRQTLLITTIVLSAVAVGVFLLMRNLRKIDPKVKAHTPVSGFDRIGVLAAIFTTFLNYAYVLSAVHGWEISEKMLFISGGVLFALLGNYMSSIKPNFFAGFRLPWTLSNENNWRRTHQLAGKLWFAGGILIAVLGWLLSPDVMHIVFLSIITIMIVIPGIYSYRLYRAGN
ncbi:MAG TPA: SdpI family protein [Chitinophagaceae bacterium]|nr:SdpI family protein [Chitinophagaceae bacterium]